MRNVELCIPDEVSDEKLLGFARCYQLEVWLREMVYLETKSHFGSNYWKECEDALKRQNALGIPPKKSLERDQMHPHMATPENDPLWFISFDTLTKLILDGALWPLFEPYLTTKKLVDAKFEELRIVRNRVAHARSLHEDDLDRFVRVLKDLDRGFWRFITSYGDSYALEDGVASVCDPVAAEFSNPERQYGVAIHVELICRPSADELEVNQCGKGRLYNVVIVSRISSRYFDYERVLSNTQPHHCLLAHMILDSLQTMLRLTFPCIEDPQSIITAILSFAKACANCYVPQPLSNHEEARLRSLQKSLTPVERFRLTNKPLDDLAAQWPHYVVSPSHPYAFLDSSMPCTIFGT